MGTTAGAMAPDTMAPTNTRIAGEGPAGLQTVSPEEHLGSTVDERHRLEGLPEHGDQGQDAERGNHDRIHRGHRPGESHAQACHDRRSDRSRRRCEQSRPAGLSGHPVVYVYPHSHPETHHPPQRGERDHGGEEGEPCQVGGKGSPAGGLHHQPCGNHQRGKGQDGCPEPEEGPGPTDDGKHQGGDLAVRVELSGQRPGQECRARRLDGQEWLGISSQGEIGPDHAGNDSQREHTPVPRALRVEGSQHVRSEFHRPIL